MKINILKPNIFPESLILSGITKRNTRLFPETGFSIYKADILTESEALNHKRILASQLGVHPEQMKCNKQVHGNNVVYMKRDSESTEADGIITDERGLLIYVKLADCAGILLFDPVKQIIAALHSGWRGTKQNIVKTGVNKLVETFSVNPNDLLAYVTPSASGKNYEVGWDVAEHFSEHIMPLGNGKYLFDNKSAITEQLKKCGLPQTSIEISDICTIADTDYHSFRRDGVKSGRMAAYIQLKINN